MSRLSILKSLDPWDGFLQEPAGGSAEQYLPALAGKRVLITGAGGFIGSALARAFTSIPIESLLLLDNSEHGLYLLDQQFQASDLPTDYRFIVGSVCDEAMLKELFARYRPHIVFHAAAMKHVQLMEANPFAAVEVNTLGTEMVARNASVYGVEQLVLISTDKAVDPISVMGASKRLAELIVLSQPSPSAKVLRLCNVLGSTGSVAPLFERQLSQGRPLTLTHCEATRFFISIERTVICLLATVGKDAKGIFIPEVGAAYRIEELARFMAEKCLHGPVEIHYTGLRRGDKLHEQMTSSRERWIRSAPADLITKVDSVALRADLLDGGLGRLKKAVAMRGLPDLIRTLRQLVPEYTAGEWLQVDTGTAAAGQL
jgi:FlaA1/EpsC-like NDP-sugar epimerase